VSGIVSIENDTETKIAPQTGPQASPLHEQVYQEVRRALMVGHYRPGDVITIRGLAGALGTSPMPVRETLRRLVSERAVEIGANRSVYVPVMTRSKYREIVNVRVALEGLAAEDAATRISEAEIERLIEVDEAILRSNLHPDDAQGARDYLALNQDYHFSIYRAAGSELLMHIIETLWLQVGPTLNYLLHDSVFAMKAAGTNRAILDALAKRDGPLARQALVTDITHAAEYLYQELPDDAGGVASSGTATIPPTG